MEIIEKIKTNKLLENQTEIQKICLQKLQSKPLPNPKSEIWRLSNKLKFSNFLNYSINEKDQKFEMPYGYSFKFGGEQEKQAEEMAFLSSALMLAVFMIFLIIVSQFNKVTTPFIIMISVILSTIGVFMGLIIFQMEFVVIMTRAFLL
mgnify:CR=1 FL=1